MKLKIYNYVLCVGFLSHDDFFNSYIYGDVTVTGEGLQNFYLKCSALMAIELWGFIYMIISEDRDTCTCCRAFSSACLKT